MDYSRPALAEAMAAQYVAGTLRGAARRRFETLLPAHPALRQAVHDWQWRLIPLTVSLAPVPPPPSVWAAIEARLWPAVAAAPVPAAAPGWWARLAFWRALSGLAGVAVLGLAVLLSTPAPDLPPVVVVLQSTGADSAVSGTIVASLSGDGHALVTRPLSPVSLVGDRVLQLWSVPSQGDPRSLGLIKNDGVTVLARNQLPPQLLKGDTAALAVSVEPPGGSPTGTPTGPVVFVGKLQL